MQKDNEAALIKTFQKVVEMSNHLRDKQNMISHNFQWEDYIKKLKQLIEFLPLHTVIALHFRKVLDKFFQAMKQLFQSSKTLDSYCIDDIKFLLQTIYENCYQCFLIHEKKQDSYGRQARNQAKYQKVIEDLINLKLINKIQKNEKFLNKLQRTVLIRRLLVQLYRIISQTTEKFKMKKQLNQFVNTMLLTEQAVYLFDQIAFNWIKSKTEIAKNENKQFICCRLHFQFQTTSKLDGFSQKTDQEFKDYRWPLENDSIKKHLTKTIVGFLNSSGGIIYVGLKQDKSKMVKVTGILLTQEQRIKFLYFLHDDILNNVFPKQQDRRQDQQNNPNKDKSPYRQKLDIEFNKKTSKKTYEYQINKYISVDFMDIYDGKTFLNIVGPKGQNLYVVRIKIKIGDLRQLYHIINQHGVPETFLREDTSVRKKNMTQFYDLFYKRMSGAYCQLKLKQKNDIHSLCRFQPFEQYQSKNAQKRQKK